MQIFDLKSNPYHSFPHSLILFCTSALGSHRFRSIILCRAWEAFGLVSIPCPTSRSRSQSVPWTSIPDSWAKVQSGPSPVRTMCPEWRAYTNTERSARERARCWGRSRCTSTTISDGNSTRVRPHPSRAPSPIILKKLILSLMRLSPFPLPNWKGVALPS